MSDKKLIIDEDWKSQVQAEKEATKGEPAAATESTAAGQQSADAGHEAGDMPMPPASLELLVTTLATEALVALGAVPHPATGEIHAHLAQAQYLIDTIDVLRQKTKGNLTPAEQQMIETVLHQLRMVFVEMTSSQPPE